MGRQGNHHVNNTPTPFLGSLNLDLQPLNGDPASCCCPAAELLDLAPHGKSRFKLRSSVFLSGLVMHESSFGVSNEKDHNWRELEG